MIRFNKKKIMALIVAGGMTFSGSHALAEVKKEGDKVKANVKVNVRINNDIKSDLVDRMKEGHIAKRILSCDNGWSLVEYNHKLGFVKNEFIDDYKNEDIYCNLDFSEERKCLITANDTLMRLDPFKEADYVSYIPANTKVDTLVLCSNDWYLVNYNGSLGFVDGKALVDANDLMPSSLFVKAITDVNIRSRASTKSEKYNILYKNDEMPFIREEKDFYVIDYYGTEAYVSKEYAKLEEKPLLPVDFIKLVCLDDDTYLFDGAYIGANAIGYIDKYETAEVLFEEGDFYFVRTLESEGYVHKSYTSQLTGMVIVVDISSQKLMLYQNNKVIFKTNIVTGKNKTPTEYGKYKIERKEDNYLIKKYQVYVERWIQYNNNYGIHDYNMKGNFGGNIYKKNGSHGCIRMHVIPVKKLYELVKVNTPVIIHK